MEVPTEQQLRNVFKTRGLTQPLRLDIFDSMLPLINELRKDGSTFLFKVDGERDPVTGNPFTIAISGKKLKDFLRTDCSDLMNGTKSVIYEYAKRCWLNEG